MVVYMDGRSRKRALHDCGRAAGPVIDEVRRLYAVISLHGEVVTVGHRHRRINRV